MKGSPVRIRASALTGSGSIRRWATDWALRGAPIMENTERSVRCRHRHDAATTAPGGRRRRAAETRRHAERGISYAMQVPEGLASPPRPVCASASLYTSTCRRTTRSAVSWFGPGCGPGGRGLSPVAHPIGSPAQVGFSFKVARTSRTAGPQLVLNFMPYLHERDPDDPVMRMLTALFDVASIIAAYLVPWQRVRG